MKRQTGSPKPNSSKYDIGHITKLRQNLENTSQVLELLQYIDISEGLTTQAQFGLFLVLQGAIDDINAVREELRNMDIKLHKDNDLVTD